MKRFQQRSEFISKLLKSISDLLHLLQPKEKFYPIAISFLNYLANPQQGYQIALETIEKSDKNFEMEWNFSTLQSAIKRQNPKTQKIANLFIDYFQKRIDLKTLKTKLAELEV